MEKILRQVGSFIDEWGGSATAKLNALKRGAILSDATNVIFTYTAYVTSYIIKKLKSQVGIEELATRKSFEEFIETASKGNLPVSILQDEASYNRMLESFRSVRRGSKNVGEAIALFDEITNKINIEDLDVLLTKNISPSSLKNVLDGALVQGADNAPVLALLRSASDESGILSLATRIKALGSSKSPFLSDLADNNFFDAIKNNTNLVDSWKALGEFPNLRKIPANLETLNKVKGKFTYNGKVGQEALEEIFTGHRSAQNFIDNFKKYDRIIGEVDDITITGIKSSSEVRILNKSNQVGKVIDGKLNVNYSGLGVILFVIRIGQRH